MQQPEYTAVAKALHWLIALLIFVLFPLAWVMGDFADPIQKFQAYNLHKSLGITVLALMVLRLSWRLLVGAPALPQSIPPLERLVAKLGHFALYVTLFLMPLTGWAMISASNKPSVLFQLRPFPLLPWLARLPADQKKIYEEIFMTAHGILANILMALIAIHILAALRHALILRDGILERILPKLPRGAKPVPAALLSLLAAALASAGGSERASAMDWSIMPDKSRISFEATGSGYTTKGTFPNYKAEVEFDPDEPEQASIRVVIDMRSATAGVADVDAVLKSSDYFDADRFPTAEFVARGAKPGDNGSYILDGRLTLKGVTKPVSLPFSLVMDGGTAKVRAQTSIDRMAFGVGPESAGGMAIDKDVKLDIALSAVRLDD